MLYKLKETNEQKFKIEPIPFSSFASQGKHEKDLENLIAESLLDVIFEDARLMPIFQERLLQPEADVYAINANGELCIFELKLNDADEGALHQLLRYAQNAGQWSFSKLEEKFKKYSKDDNADLIQCHKEAFDLEHALHPNQFNQKQHLYVIGSASDSKLRDASDYWIKQGLSIKFLPYRIYDINGSKYFEFFSPPYDVHRNPNEAKGVLFDTNMSFDVGSIWYMIDKSCVAAFGDAKRFVEYVNPGDIVFLTHKGKGIIAAGKVKNSSIKSPDNDTKYRELDFLTPKPKKDAQLIGMPFSKVIEITGKSFFWARTIKVPYLTIEESKILVDHLNQFLTNNTLD